MQTEVRELMHGSVTKCLERAEKLPDGSEERARELKNAAALVSTLGEDYKIMEDRLDKGHKLEYDHEIESRKLDIEEVKMEKESKWRIKPDTLANLGCLTLLTFAGAALEAHGYRLPKAFDSLRNRIGRPKD